MVERVPGTVIYARYREIQKAAITSCQAFVKLMSKREDHTRWLDGIIELPDTITILYMYVFIHLFKSVGTQMTWTDGI
jgi:hypothetical protein